jgi:hypothetical protein
MSSEERLDPRTGATLVLAPDGLTILSPDGDRAFIPAPEGYALSHFGPGASIVARGSAKVDGWWDWHFEADVEGGLLRRLGPAY